MGAPDGVPVTLLLSFGAIMATSVPGLLGRIDGAAEKLDYLFAAYFVSEQSQSNLYLGRVISLPFQIQAYAQDPVQLRQVMSSTLQSYLDPYFDQTDVRISVEDTVGDEGRLTVRVDATVVQDGATYSVGHAIQALASGKLVEIMKINNEIGAS